MRHTLHRNAFTLIELLFVIVIMGIVGGLSLSVVQQYYQDIYRSQTYSQRIETADHVLDQLEIYFSSAISYSILNLDQEGEAAGCFGIPLDGDNNDYTVAFVAVDQDIMRTSGAPGWSGNVGLIAGANTLQTLDSDLAEVNTIMTGLGTSLAQSAIYDADSVDVGGCARFNFNVGDGIAGYHRIANVNNITGVVTLNNENLVLDGKKKYLLRTGYAFRVDRSNEGKFYLYTHFAPWNNERYDDDNTKRYLLAEKVNHFYLSYDNTNIQTSNADGTVLRLKVCMQGLDENMSDSENNSKQICRERSVHVRY